MHSIAAKRRVDHETSLCSMAKPLIMLLGTFLAFVVWTETTRLSEIDQVSLSSDTEADHSQATIKSYSDTFSSFLKKHQLAGKPEYARTPPAFNEYEPHQYTDNVTLPYKLIGLRNLTVGEEAVVYLDTGGAVLPNHPSSS